MIEQTAVGERYEVLEKVGESALFAVYKARDRSQNRIVALKALQPSFASDTEFVSALRSALQPTASLDHPNIDRFLDFQVEDGMAICVFEFVRGINLNERVRRIAPFSLSVAVDYACAIGEALHYAHGVGQPHGDLRPRNVIISPEGSLKVTDFGVQRTIAGSERAQQEQLAAAAPYHAPELSLKQPGTVAGDIYAVGCILYEMLTGTPVYLGDTPDAISDQHALSAIPSPRTLNTGVPRSVEGIIIKCLQKRPEYRYRSAAELLVDLKAVRDALRFGKPLSWSPVDNESAAAAPAPPEPVKPAPAPPVKRVVEPEPEPAEDSVASTMTNRNRLRAADDRVSVYIKIAIGVVMAIIMTCGIVLVGIYMKFWVLPEPVAVPRMVGHSISDVRILAQSKGLHLIEHGDYSDKTKDVVYKSDYDPTHKLRPGQTINVWYSKGPTYVQVPKVEGLDRDLAEKRLKEAGLQVGRVLTQFSNTVLSNVVINQNVSYRKRVFHDTVVDLVVSDGPKADEPGTENAGVTTDENAPTADAGGQPGDTTTAPTEGNTDTGPNGEVKRTFNRSISIPSNDKLGLRQVRIEYRDATGWHPPVLDELHNEGDKIPIQFDYFGDKVMLRVFYDGRFQTDLTFKADRNGDQH